MHLFVYGTLRRSAAHPMHRLLEEAEFVGTGRFQGKLYDLGSYPAAVVSDEPGDAVRGELYRLREPAAILAALDRYEGCAADDPEPHEYRRTSVDIQLETTGESTVVSAQVYLYQRPTETLTRIAPGDYLDWLAQRAASPNDAPEKRTPPADSTTISG